MASEGPLSGSSSTNSGSGFAWTNLSNVYASDNSYAGTGIHNLAPGQSTQYGEITGFGFSIPSGATIDGILIEDEINGSMFASSINAMRVIKGGTVGSTNLSTASLTASDVYYSGGGASNLCGETWTYSDINASNFGCALKVQSDAWPAHSFQWDHSRITVYYTAAGDTTAPILTSPSAQPTSQTKATGYVTTDEANGTLYEVATTSSTAPSAAQVKAGQDHTGSSATWSGSQSISSTGQKTCTATGLSAGTTYYFHYMHEDAAANQSTVVSSAAFITSNSGAPVISGSMTTGAVLYPIFAARRIRAYGRAPVTVGVQSTATMPIAWQQSLLLDATLAIAWQQAIANVSTIPIVYQQEISNSQTLAIAYQQSIAISQTMPSAWQQEISTAQVLPIAYQQDIATDSTLPIAYQQSLYSNQTIPIAYQQSIVADSSLTTEWGGYVSASADIPIAYQQTIATDSTLAIAYQQSITVAKTIPIAWLQSLVIDSTIPLKWDGNVTSTANIPIAWQSSIAADSSLPIAYQQEFNTSQTLPIAYQQSIATSQTIPIAYQQSFVSTDSLPIHWIGYVSADNTIPIAFQAEISTAQTLTVAYQQSLSIAENLSIAWLQSVSYDASIPIEWVGVPSTVLIELVSAYLSTSKSAATINKVSSVEMVIDTSDSRVNQLDVADATSTRIDIADASSSSLKPGA